MKNARLDAKLTLYVNFVKVASGVMENPGGYVFELTTPLDTGQLVAVTQNVLGAVSAPGGAIVRDHTEDYPDGLPPPSIVPAPVYECAKAIAVSQVRGATITVEKVEVGGQSSHHSKESGYDRTWIRLGSAGPFHVGDAFTATQKLCDDISDSSEQVVATNAPAFLPEVTFEQPMADQQFITLESIVQGSRVTLNEEPSLVVVDRASVPFNRLRNIDLLDTPLGAIANTDELVATQKLCKITSPKPQPPGVLQCDPATFVPEIARPMHGDNFVLVTSAVPGATIRVFGPGFEELGNGIGSVIGLTRDLIGGETIAVTESLPTCAPAAAFSIVVQTP